MKLKGVIVSFFFNDNNTVGFKIGIYAHKYNLTSRFVLFQDVFMA